MQRASATAFRWGRRPQTLYGIADLPIGLAAYFLDHDARSYEMISVRCSWRERKPHPRPCVLDNITLTWLTNTALQAPVVHRDKGASFFAVKGVAVRPPEVSSPTNSILLHGAGRSRLTPKLIHFNKLPKGGHFAAWEQPKLFSGEICAGFRSLR